MFGHFEQILLAIHAVNWLGIEFQANDNGYHLRRLHTLVPYGIEQANRYYQA